jgi:hypothetical protein
MRFNMVHKQTTRTSLRISCRIKDYMHNIAVRVWFIFNLENMFLSDNTRLIFKVRDTQYKVRDTQYKVRDTQYKVRDTQLK